jgi:phosphosulfolactate phosphohydrolase-like enzyme
MPLAHPVAVTRRTDHDVMVYCAGFKGMFALDDAHRADIGYCAQENLLETVPRFARMVGAAAEIVA